MEVGEEGDYTEEQSHKTVFINHSCFKEKREPKRNRTEVLLLTSVP